MLIENKKCEICFTKPARMVIFRRRRNDCERTLVCETCASERSRLYSDVPLDIESVLVRIERRAVGDAPLLNCRLCGTSLADVAVNPRPGCCLCYERFESAVRAAVVDAQGAVYHVGKHPPR